MVYAKFNLVLRPISHGNPAMPFYLFFQEKNQISLKIYTHTQKGIENKKITFLENIKNIPINLFLIINFSTDVLPLSTRGNQMLIGDTPGILCGNSFFWSNNGWGGERFYNEDVVKWLKSDWKSTVVRAAMGVELYGGYLQDPESNKARVKAVIDAAIEFDMYVIIDWHSHNAHRQLNEAIKFFEEMAETYNGYNHIIYEIWNEPRDDVTWEHDVKPYSLAVIKAIRAIDKKNLIVVGSPFWDQDVDIVANDPITEFQNIAYSLHFYAGSHRQQLRDKAAIAISKNITLFATEWGTVSIEPNGGVDEKETELWIKFLKDHNISNANWNVSDKPEGAAILINGRGVSSNGGWSESDLTESGILVRNIIRNWASENELKN